MIFLELPFYLTKQKIIWKWDSWREITLWAFGKILDSKKFNFSEEPEKPASQT